MGKGKMEKGWEKEKWGERMGKVKVRKDRKWEKGWKKGENGSGKN